MTTLGRRREDCRLGCLLAVLAICSVSCAPAAQREGVDGSAAAGRLRNDSTQAVAVAVVLKPADDASFTLTATAADTRAAYGSVRLSGLG